MTLLQMVMLGIALLLLMGCSKAVPPGTSPEVARQTLNQVLERWKAGQKIDSDKNWVVTDSQWQKGIQLLGYEIVGDPQPSGFDIQFQVKLTLQHPNGRTTKENATYTVATTHAIVVIRTEQGS